MESTLLMKKCFRQIPEDSGRFQRIQDDSGRFQKISWNVTRDSTTSLPLVHFEFLLRTKTLKTQKMKNKTRKKRYLEFETGAY